MDKLWDIYCEDFWENWPRYNGTTLYVFGLVWKMSITWLLMTWWLASPGYQQPWYWLLLRFVCQEGTSLQTPQHYCQFSVFPGYSSWSPEELKQCYLIHKCLLHHWYWYQNNFWGNMCAFSAELADGIALLYVRTSADQPMRLPVKIHPLHPHPQPSTPTTSTPTPTPFPNTKYIYIYQFHPNKYRQIINLPCRPFCINLKVTCLYERY